MFASLRRLVLGKPRDIRDPHVFHRISLAAFLAWVGLGADGLSSSAYGPEEAFKALGIHTHLSPFLILMTAATIFIIAIAYSNLIEHFPGGGGGYLVATKLLGEKAGLVSGCALLVDYVLTISISVASGCDALWSFLPPHWQGYKLTAEMGVLFILLMLNLRGVRESVTIMAPVFMVFILTHTFMIFYVVLHHVPQLPVIAKDAVTDVHSAISALGFIPVAMILLRAYSLGGGTYTGIEAVSNGVSMLREPRVQTGKRTMLLMAASLAFMAGGILLGYLLTGATPVDSKTMNAVLFESLFQVSTWGGFPIGHVFVVVALASEAALLFVAAQAGFLDGPRVLANMAVDSWVPHRFSQLSSRLVTHNGIVLMSIAALGTLLYTQGSVSTLVVMYSINVFLTFSLTELGMSTHWIRHREDPRWKSQLAIHGTGLILCSGILIVTLYEKFSEGGWVTAIMTSAVVACCFFIRRHYRDIRDNLRRLDSILEATPAGPVVNHEALDPRAPTAIVTVGGYSGFGLHQVLSIQKLMPGYFKNFVFVSVGVLDSGNFKGSAEVDRLTAQTRENLEKYVAWCRSQGFPADYRMRIGTEAVETLDALCQHVSREFPRSIIFAGKLIFREETWLQRLLHNETASALQHRLQFAGLQTIVLPIRLL